MRSLSQPRLGDVWSANVDPIGEHEQGGVSPGLVISNNLFNRTLYSLCFLIPLTGTDQGIPAHASIHPPEGGLQDSSFIL